MTQRITGSLFKNVKPGWKASFESISKKIRTSNDENSGRLSPEPDRNCFSKWTQCYTILTRRLLHPTPPKHSIDWQEGLINWVTSSQSLLSRPSIPNRNHTSTCHLGQTRSGERPAWVSKKISTSWIQKREVCREKRRGYRSRGNKRRNNFGGNTNLHEEEIANNQAEMRILHSLVAFLTHYILLSWYPLSDFRPCVCWSVKTITRNDIWHAFVLTLTTPRYSSILKITISHNLAYKTLLFHRTLLVIRSFFF